MKTTTKYGVFRHSRNKLSSVNTFVNEEQAIYLKNRLMEQRSTKAVAGSSLYYIVKPIKVLSNGK